MRCVRVQIAILLLFLVSTLAFADENPGDDGPKDDGPKADGSTEDEPTNDGTQDEEPTDDGPTGDGATVDGTQEDDPPVCSSTSQSQTSTDDDDDDDGGEGSPLEDSVECVPATDDGSTGDEDPRLVSKLSLQDSDDETTSTSAALAGIFRLVKISELGLVDARLYCRLVALHVHSYS